MFSSTQPGHAPRPKRILLVEDNELNMRLVAEILSAHGFALLTAQDGSAALQLAPLAGPDLILLDIQLPDMSGIDVSRQLKADPRTSAIPIIAVTAFAMKGDEDRIREGGCDGYVAKPISVRKFLSTIEAFL